MLATTQNFAVDLAFPDICKVPPMVPTPFPNTAISNTAVPVALNILFNNSYAHNLATTNPVSIGDQAGVLLGLISETVGATSRKVGFNSYHTLLLCMPANRVSCVGPHNNINTAGGTVSPGCRHINIFAD